MCSFVSNGATARFRQTIGGFLKSSRKIFPVVVLVLTRLAIQTTRQEDLVIQRRLILPWAGSEGDWRCATQEAARLLHGVVRARANCRKDPL
jgi:hypothetical protein